GGRRTSRAAPTEHAPGGAGQGERDARARGDVEMLCATGVRGAEEEPERLARGERADGERQGGGDGGRGRRGVAAGERRRRETRAARLPDERRDDAPCAALDADHERPACPGRMPAERRGGRGVA